MRATSFLRLLTILAVVADLIAVVQYGHTHPWLYALLVVAIVAAAIAPATDRIMALWTFRRVLSEAEGILSRRNIHPRRIIAFDRSSAIFGGMLCQRLAVSELIVLPRHATESQAVGPREIHLGEHLKVALDEKSLSESLVVVFYLRTGATLEAGLKAICPRGRRFHGNVLVLFASHGGAARWPSVCVVRTCAIGEVPNDRLPWISGDYVHK